jgi:hypothetical protein
MTQNRLNFAAWIRHKGAILHTRFSSEAHFYLDGLVKKQSITLWANEHPHCSHERDIFVKNITVWVTTSMHRIIELFFFSDMDNSKCFLVLYNNFILQLFATELLINLLWFMQDGTRLYTANFVLDFLHGNFGPQVISHCFPGHRDCGQVWPPYGTDINLWNLYFWICVKEKQNINGTQNHDHATVTHSFRRHVPQGHHTSRFSSLRGCRAEWKAY